MRRETVRVARNCRRVPVLLGVLLATGVLAVGAASAGAEPPTLTIPRVASPPRLDDVLAGAPPPGVKVEGFRQREPGDGDPASQPTSAYLSYDDDHLYAVFVCHDEPGRVRANLTRREAILEDDVVGLILDTYHDGRRSYMFLVNPFGIQLDGVTAEGQDDDYTYDTLWRSEGRLNGDGFVVLMAIPFKSLRFSNAAEQVWGVAVARILQRTNETVFWPYVTRRISGMGSQLATLEGVRGVSPGRNLQAIPYASFASARLLGEDARRTTDGTARAGIDGKAVIRDAVTVDLTVNPDFSQVESDEPQVTINQRFEVFFPEKRPFFIENANYFVTPQQLFFSRRIADPDFGARVTGRTHGWSFAGLFTDDRLAGHAVPQGDPRADDRTWVGVARVRREFARQSSLGAIVTDRRFGNGQNTVYGVDGRWKLDDNWSIEGQFVGSRTELEAGGSLDGSSGRLELVREGRGFDYFGSFTSRSPEFRADLGFIPRVDLLETEQEAGYDWRFAKGRVLRVSANVELDALWDYGGTLQEWTAEPGVEIEFPRQTEVGVRHWKDFERFAGIDFRRHRTAVYGSTAWTRWFAADVFADWGTRVNYFPGPALVPFLAGYQGLEASVVLRPASNVRVEQRYLFTRLRTRDDGEFEPVAAGDVFNNHIARARLDYQFTRELSGRVIVDYEAVLPNQSLVSLERQKRMHLDVLATYLLNPWTAVYVGYTDAYENWRVSPLSPPAPALVRGGSPFTSVGRQVFVKLSYLLRY